MADNAVLDYFLKVSVSTGVGAVVPDFTKRVVVIAASAVDQAGENFKLTTVYNSGTAAGEISALTDSGLPKAVLDGGSLSVDIITVDPAYDVNATDQLTLLTDYIGALNGTTPYAITWLWDLAGWLNDPTYTDIVPAFPDTTDNG